MSNSPPTTWETKAREVFSIFCPTPETPGEQPRDLVAPAMYLYRGYDAPEQQMLYRTLPFARFASQAQLGTLEIQKRMNDASGLYMRARVAALRRE